MVATVDHSPKSRHRGVAEEKRSISFNYVNPNPPPGLPADSDWKLDHFKTPQSLRIPKTEDYRLEVRDPHHFMTQLPKSLLMLLDGGLTRDHQSCPGVRHRRSCSNGEEGREGSGEHCRREVVVLYFFS